MPDMIAGTNILEAAHVADEPTLTALFHNTGRPPVGPRLPYFAAKGQEPHVFYWQVE